MRLSSHPMLIPAAFVSILAMGCSDLPHTTDPVPVQANKPGTLEVFVTTSGSELDDDGYVIVANRPSDAEGNSGEADLPVNGRATLSGLVPDTYSIAFSGLAPNCDLVTPAAQKTVVASGRVTQLNIQIQCTNSLQLTYLLGGSLNAGDSLPPARQFWISDLSGRNATRLTTDAASHETPAWSPDGSSMAFGSNRGGRSGIWLIDVAGHVEALNTGLPEDFGPRWSPDGRRIVFFSLIDGKTQLFSINADGTDLRGITAGSPGDYDPDWSPDGTKIVFASKRDDIPGIWVVNVDGTAPTRISSSSSGQSNPVWSPDGSRIAFTQVGQRSRYSILTMKADGSASAYLADSGPLARPSWSPNGRKIAFTGQGIVQIAGVDGTGYTPITISVASGDVAWRQRR